MRMKKTSVLEFASRTRSHPSATFLRVGLATAIAFAPVTAALAQGTQAPGNNQQKQVDGQRRATPGRLTIPIGGTLETAAAGPTTPTTEAPQAEADAPTAVTGSFSIQRFARTTEDAIAAVGTLTLSFTDPSSDAPRTIVTQVAVPLAKSDDTTTPGPGDDGQAQPAGRTAQRTASVTAQACEPLSLVLGALELELLGLTFQLDQMQVDFTAVQGTSQRLGNALCEVSGLMDGARPVELVNTLNGLLDMIG
jgi:hypothetical protein